MSMIHHSLWENIWPECCHQRVRVGFCSQLCIIKSDVIAHTYLRIRVILHMCEISLLIYWACMEPRPPNGLYKREQKCCPSCLSPQPCINEPLNKQLAWEYCWTDFSDLIAWVLESCWENGSFRHPRFQWCLVNHSEVQNYHHGITGTTEF